MEEKKYTLKGIDGKEIEVTEEVYRVIKRDEDREAQRRYRAWRCRDGKGVRCKKRCEECEYYRSFPTPQCFYQLFICHVIFSFS